MELSALQDSVDQWIKKHGVRYFSELTNLGLLMEEVGELARIMTRTYGEQSFKSSDHDVKMEEELADVLFVLVCISNQCDVDLEKAFKNNLEKKTNRDSERHKQNKKLK
ncbi:MAG: nucleotide pyrophosphohydrolase [Vicingaceae bacterium]